MCVCVCLCVRVCVCVWGGGVGRVGMFGTRATMGHCYSKIFVLMSQIKCDVIRWFFIIHSSIHINFETILFITTELSKMFILPSQTIIVCLISHYMLNIIISVKMQVNSDILSLNCALYINFLNTTAISVLNYLKYQCGALGR